MYKDDSVIEIFVKVVQSTVKVRYVDSFTFQMYGMAVADKLDKSKHRTIFQRRYFRQVCTRRAYQSMCPYLYTGLLSMHHPCTRAHRSMCPYFVHRPSKYAPALYKGSSVNVSLLLLSSPCKSCKWQTLGSGAWEQE